MTPGELTLVGDVLSAGRIRAGTVTVRNGMVGGPPAPASRRLVIPEGWVLSPGLVDLQVNGYAGHEVTDGPESLVAIARTLASDGVTAFCPTVVSRECGRYRPAAAVLGGVPSPAGAARRLGVHLEGPFLAPARSGAHRREALRSPDPAAVDSLVSLFRPALMTLAPELPGAVAAVARLRRAGVRVSIGHTEADAATVHGAIAAGARLITHALNAMPGITARGPDGLAAALLDRRVPVMLIADGVHVVPTVCALMARVAGSRLTLVSDATAPAGAPAGIHRLAGATIRSDGRRARTSEGALAGGVAPLWAGVAGLVSAGLSRAAALDAAVSAPRRVLGLGDPLTPGRPADLVLWDAAGRPRCTMVGGVPAGPDPAEAVAQSE